MVDDSRRPAGSGESGRHDLVVWGATGFTGRLVAHYLDLHAPADLRWAIGGRDPAKLERLRGALQRRPPLVSGDSLDPPSMARLAAGTRVVLSTVGPFARYGTPLVEACVDAGVDYCDITGELPWIRGNVDRFHERARASGARIVHSCGFDSIPSDLGVWMLHEHLRREHGEALGSARFYLMKSRGKFSGGTVASILEVVRQAAADRELRRILADPYALDPDRRGGNRDDPEASQARFDERIQRWTAPFLMAGINTRIVRRSNALLGYPYGPEFDYSEVMATRSRGQARTIRAGLGGMLLAASFAPTRWLLRRWLPGPGEGPTAEERASGFFEILLLGRAAGPDGREIRGRVRGENDPGYGETSKMLAEAALCLALDRPRAPGGVTTPAAALGAPLLDRLRRAGMTFAVEPG